jgi:DNA-binding transcriptional LysR family regulator
MGPRQLQSFIAVAEELHFGRAAKRVNLSQPALSLQIKSMEEELQVTLLSRSRRKTELTQAGQIFLSEAREVLERIEQAVSKVRRASLGEVGTLNVGFISTAAAVILPPLVKRFREKHKHVEMDLRNVLTRDQVVQLQEGKIDVGFLRVPFQTPPEIRTRVIHRESFILLVPANHPLANKKNLRLSDCHDANFIMYSQKMAPGFHNQILNILERNGVNPRIVQEASEMYTLISLVAAGIGLAVAPASVGMYRPEGVVVRELVDETAQSEIAIAWNINRLSMSAHLFLQMVFEESKARRRMERLALVPPLVARTADHALAC